MYIILRLISFLLIPRNIDSIGMEETSLMKFVKKKSKKWFLKLETMITNNWVSQQ